MVFEIGGDRMRSREDERVWERRDDATICSGKDVDGYGGVDERTSLRSGVKEEMPTSSTGQKMVGGETGPETKRILLYAVVAAMRWCQPIGQRGEKVSSSGNTEDTTNGGSPQ